jgi:hypothetical protein
LDSAAEAGGAVDNAITATAAAANGNIGLKYRAIEEASQFECGTRITGQPGLTPHNVAIVRSRRQ